MKRCMIYDDAQILSYLPTFLRDTVVKCAYHQVRSRDACTRVHRTEWCCTCLWRVRGAEDPLGTLHKFTHVSGDA